MPTQSRVLGGSLLLVQLRVLFVFNSDTLNKQSEYLASRNLSLHPGGSRSQTTSDLQELFYYLLNQPKLLHCHMDRECMRY